MAGGSGASGGTTGHAARARAWWSGVRFIRRRYRRDFGVPPRLLRPRTQSERIQHRKLFLRDPRLPQRQDKIEVKRHVASVVGAEHVVPNLWTGTALPPRHLRTWPRPFVLKAAHGSGWNVMVPAEGPVRWGRIERRVERWMGTTYGERSGEWLYSRIPPRLLVEPHVGDPRTVPDDYKLWVYRGRVQFIHWSTGRGTSDYRGRVLDRRWREAFEARLVPRSAEAPPRPDSLEVMIEMAEALAEDWPFVRVDLYDVAGRPVFGEFTFYPSSGFHCLWPPGTDEALGELWDADRAVPANVAPDRALAGAGR